jgi:glycosyltransferase involved in cell wall biosynthesis
MGKPTDIGVSAVLIVRDEEEGLARAIGSARKLAGVDEVVVVDTGSTDRTISIAKGLGAKVFEEPWTGDYAYHRNRAMERCSNDWVFFVDGDEELVDAGNIDAVLAQGGLDGVALTMHCQVNGRVEEESVMVRLFDRRRGRWEHAIHEQLTGLEDVVMARGLMVAEYDETFEASSLSRLAKLLEQEPLHPGESHYPYFIAKTYRSLHDFESLETWARKYLGLGLEEAREAEIWVWLVEAAMQAGDLPSARSRCASALQRHASYPDLLHLLVALSVHSWWEACTNADPRYLTVARRSLRHLDNLQPAAELLGLPMELKVDDPDG